MENTVLAVRSVLYQVAHFTVHDGIDPVIYVKHGGSVQELRGQDAHTVMTSVLSYVDGTRTVEEVIMATVHAGFSRPWAEQALGWLLNNGICAVDATQPEDDALRISYQMHIRHFGHYVSSPTLRQKRLQDSQVAVFGLEYLGSLLVEQLAAAGVGHIRGIGNAHVLPEEAALLGWESSPETRHAQLSHQVRARHAIARYDGVTIHQDEPMDWQALLADCHLAVLVLPQQCPTVLRAFNRAGLAQRIPFLAVWCEETGGHIGPLVLPYETACLCCLELRQRSRWAPEEVHLLQWQHNDALATGWEKASLLFPWIAALAAITTSEIVTALTRYRRPASAGHAITVHASSWYSKPEPVLKVPHCPMCSRARTTPVGQPFTLHLQED